MSNGNGGSNSNGNNNDGHHHQHHHQHHQKQQQHPTDMNRIRNNSVLRDHSQLPVNPFTITSTTTTTTTTTIQQQQPLIPMTNLSLSSTTNIISTSTTSAAATAAAAIAVTAAAITTSTPIVKGHVVSEKTVEALGDWLLESASVQSVPASQEQRRKESYKSSSLINKTMKQSQEERRRQALAEQAKKRYQFTNHARKLALFASGQPAEESSDSEKSDSQNDEDEEDEEDDNENEDDEDENDADELEEQGSSNNDDSTIGQGAKKKKRRAGNKHSSSDKGKKNDEGTAGKSLVSPPTTKSTTAANKRRLSSGSESESLARRKTDNTGDILSPKKPRLQKSKSSDIVKKRRRRDRNPFRDQMMIPEALTDIPIDLDSSYYIVPLPIGHRCFVISADGKTTARLPSGQLLVTAFESCLPAGSSQYRGNRRSDYCILDCVYSSVTRTFWTLDIMCWRGHPVYECETEFRFWWLRGKLAEIEELQGKWITSQTKEWEHEMEKKRQKRARQIKKRQEKAAAIAAASSMDVVPTTESPDIAVQEECDDGDDEAGTEGMDIEENIGLHNSRTGNGGSGSNIGGGNSRKFWPVVFTPLPYFNASINLVRLLAESMHQPTPTPSLPSSPPIFMSKDPASSIPVNVISAVLPSPLSSSSTTLTTKPTIGSNTVSKNSTPVTSLSLKSHPKSIRSTPNNTTASGNTPPSTLGTMALSGEIATAAALFPAHDKKQIQRQDQTLVHERAAGLVFFNKKTMYVLGTTPLCGWVSMDLIGDVFFDEEGGIGPVPGTSAAEGREVEMEDALERIRI
ncbi:hypothetical protein BGZ46_008176 [Entomortierella lignicola]|nr:hypothetical protein BGZ46_008176 [Entomortierella lignicola]